MMILLFDTGLLFTGGFKCTSPVPLQGPAGHLSGFLALRGLKTLLKPVETLALLMGLGVWLALTPKYYYVWPIKECDPL